MFVKKTFRNQKKTIFERELLRQELLFQLVIVYRGC